MSQDALPSLSHQSVTISSSDDEEQAPPPKKVKYSTYAVQSSGGMASRNSYHLDHSPRKQKSSHLNPLLDNDADEIELGSPGPHNELPFQPYIGPEFGALDPEYANHLADLEEDPVVQEKPERDPSVSLL